MTARKVTAVLLAMLIAVTGFTAMAPQDVHASASTTFEALDFDYDRNNVYSAFMEKHTGVAKPDEEIAISASSFIGAESSEGIIARETIDGVNDVVEFLEDVQWVEYEFTVPVAGLYNIAYMVRSHESIKNDIEFGVMVNGEYQYNEAMTIQSFRGFKNDPQGFEVVDDGNGHQYAVFAQDRENDLRPKQIKDIKWRNEWLVDSAGLIDDPLYFYFEEGVNKIRIETVGEPFYISNITLKQFVQPKSYAEVSAEYAAKGYKMAGSQIKVQGETASEFSHSSLYPLSERNNPQMEPYHTSKTRVNAAGGSNWGSARSWLKWTFNAPESGLYQLAIKFEQSDYVGMFATRSLKIDGEYPFAEMKYLRFGYDSSWQFLRPTDENGEPYYIYLEKGKHDLQLTVSLGEMASIVDRLTTVVYRLNKVYSDIVMLASTTPDPYRDYYYDRNIPTLMGDLTWAREELANIKEEILAVTGTGSSQTATLETFVIQLDNLIKDTDEFNKQLESFKNNIASISQWIIDNKKQPIKIDYFVLGGENIELDKPEAGFFKGFWAGTKSFFASFFEDYDIIGAVTGEGRKVKVWVNTGRDQINIINNMVNDEFTPKSGINVQLELVQGNMIEATLAGKGPDVALMIAADQPVNYAIRNALVDLSEFEGETYDWVDGEGKQHTYKVNGFTDVFGRYQHQNFEAFAFQLNKHKDEEAEKEGEIWVCENCGTENNQGICTTCNYKKYYAYYAIPETQTFNMMFYRKDILAQLGLGVPETWDDFFALLPVLRRNNLEAGIPAATMYQILLYQYDGSYYTEDKHASGLTTPQAQKAFITVADCFTKYDFPITFNFYTRFRSGEMPISIQPYTQFNMINAAAPEIQGLWDMTKVPGTIKEDGTMDNGQNVSSAGCVMFQNTKDKKAAWAFMDWYNSNAMQTRYGEELESVMGAAGRYAAANQEAFTSLAWTRQQTRLLSEQMDALVGVPEVPGSYFTGRTVTLAFNDAYVEHENPYKALSERAEDLDEEIARKYEEFGLY